MKTLTMCAVLACLVVPALAAESDSGKAEQEIRARAKEFVGAWEKHDGKLLADFFTPDGDLVTSEGHSYSGHDEIEHTLSDAFESSLKDSTFSWTVEKVKLVKPDLAIVDYDAQIKGPDAVSEPTKFHVVSVLLKQGDKWLTVTSRGVVYTGG